MREIEDHAQNDRSEDDFGAPCFGFRLRFVAHKSHVGANAGGRNG